MNIENLITREAAKAVNHVVLFQPQIPQIQEILLEHVLQPIHHYTSFVRWDSQLMTAK